MGKDRKLKKMYLTNPGSATIVADPDLHHFWNLDPDPHQSGKLDDQNEKQDP
jgi:hypothetical protein